MINDFGAQVLVEALLKLANQIDFDQYVEFQNFKEAVFLVKKICKDFGPHSDFQWKKLAESFVSEESNEGIYKIHFDPAIVSQFRRIFNLFGRSPTNSFFKMPGLKL